MSERVFVKRRVDAPPGFFAAEAAGLSWLAEAGGARCVRVMEVESDRIVLERLQPGPHSTAAAEEFGTALVRTHSAGAPGFGSPPPGVCGDAWIGDAPLPLRRHTAWGEFYATERVLPYARAAAAGGALRAPAFKLIERVCDRLGAGEFDNPCPPARIHGDLWAGNVVATPAGYVLIDPAAHGGHPLTDLAMLALFGHPKLAAIVSAYAAQAHLGEGWDELLPLHQLHPLLVHAVLFGGSYGAHAADIAGRYAR